MKFLCFSFSRNRSLSSKPPQIIPKYVERDDLITLLEQKFPTPAGASHKLYAITTSTEGTHLIQAPSKITDREIQELQDRSAARRSPYQRSVFNYSSGVVEENQPRRA